LNHFFTERRFSFEIKRYGRCGGVITFALTAVIIANLVARGRRAGLKDRLQPIIDTIPASISHDGSADFMNKQFRDYTGISLEDMRGWAWSDAVHRPWMHVLHPDDRVMDYGRAALADGEPFEREARLRSVDGEYRRFLLRFVPLRDERGSIVEWYTKSTDVEDQRRIAATRGQIARRANGARAHQSHNGDRPDGGFDCA
jgi:PAS domain-containing protein